MGYADKVQKVAGPLLRPDERVVSAIRTQPRGTNTGVAVGGLIGGAVADRQAAKARAGTTEGSRAADWPSGKLAVALTDQRLLAFNFTAMGKPKEITGEFPIQDVAEVVLESKKLMQTVRFGFSDGSSVVVECGRLENVGDFVEAFDKAKANQN